jgi:tRNA A37 threonylcarbamoyladenosine synthetase subunit TsaC/SUA5/YrdC
MSVTLILPGDEMPLLDPYEIKSLLSNRVDMIIDGGFCGIEPTSVIDLSEDEPKILREGAGSVEDFKIQ